METQKTVTTFLMRILMINGGVLMAYFMIITNIQQHAPGIVVGLYNENPLLTCSLLNSMVPGVMFLNTLFLILCSKCYMMFNTTKYLELNHDKLSKIFLICIIIFDISEFLFLFLVYGNLCPKMTLINFQTVYNVGALENVLPLPPMIIIHGLMLLIPESIFLVQIVCKRRKRNRYVSTTQGLFYND